MEYREQHVRVAQEFAEKGLNGDHYDHNNRMEALAYAQVHAELATSAALRDLTEAVLAAVERGEQNEDVLVGVQFDDGPAVYSYLAPPSVNLWSLVVVPPSVRCAMPQVRTVVTLDPPSGWGGPLKRVLAVLS